MCGIKFQETFGNNVGVSDLSKKIIREKSIRKIDNFQKR
jgi:hypothetical protein